MCVYVWMECGWRYVCLDVGVCKCMYGWHICVFVTMNVLTICVCKYICIFVCMHACMHVCIYVCMYICKYVCMYLYMFIHTFI